MKLWGVFGVALWLVACGPGGGAIPGVTPPGKTLNEDPPGAPSTRSANDSASGPLQQSGSDGDEDGDGVADENDQCPDVPEDFDAFSDADGCPDPDNDADGISDVDDLCPNDPEDRDGFEDSDGCPEPDNDGDGILDMNDKCPNEPESIDGTNDEDGCPD